MPEILSSLWFWIVIGVYAVGALLTPGLFYIAWKKSGRYHRCFILSVLYGTTIILWVPTAIFAVVWLIVQTIAGVQPKTEQIGNTFQLYPKTEERDSNSIYDVPSIPNSPFYESNGGFLETPVVELRGSVSSVEGDSPAPANDGPGYVNGVNNQGNPLIGDNFIHIYANQSEMNTSEYVSNPMPTIDPYLAQERDLYEIPPVGNSRLRQLASFEPEPVSRDSSSIYMGFDESEYLTGYAGFQAFQEILLGEGDGSELYDFYGIYDDAPYYVSRPAKPGSAGVSEKIPRVVCKLDPKLLEKYTNNDAVCTICLGPVVVTPSKPKPETPPKPGTPTQPESETSNGEDTKNDVSKPPTVPRTSVKTNTQNTSNSAENSSEQPPVVMRRPVGGASSNLCVGRESSGLTGRHAADTNQRDTFITNCEHAFHYACIDLWLQTNANCPYCRAAIQQEKCVVIHKTHRLNRDSTCSQPTDKTVIYENVYGFRETTSYDI